MKYEYNIINEAQKHLAEGKPDMTAYGEVLEEAKLIIKTEIKSLIF